MKALTPGFFQYFVELNLNASLTLHGFAVGPYMGINSFKQDLFSA